jgi:hypothetical protein
MTGSLAVRWLTLLFGLPLAVSARADVRVTAYPYVRQDGSSDAVITTCSNVVSGGTDAGGRRQQNEPSVAIDPNDPDLVVVSANDYCTGPSFGDAWQGVYVSRDGGHVFRDSLLPGYPGDTSSPGKASPLFGVDTAAGDPILGWDYRGRLFAGGIAFNRTAMIGQGGKTQTNGVMYVSTWMRNPTSALGISYQRTVIVGPGTPSVDFEGRVNDKPSLAVDSWQSVYGTSPYAGNVYAAWTLYPGAGQNQVLFSRSTDHGITFSRPIILSKSVPNAQGSTIAVASNGDVYVFWRQFAGVAAGVNDAIVFVKSTDGGGHFTDPATVREIVGYDRADIYATGGPARDCGSGPYLCLSGFTFHRAATFPMATADVRANVFVTWEEVTPVTDNGDTYHPDGQAQVVLSRSSNGGMSWSDPFKVDPQPKGHQFWPKIASDGMLLVIAYYDSRRDPAYLPTLPPGNTPVGTSSGPSLDTFLTLSTDGGLTWNVGSLISTESQQPEYEMFGDRQSPFHGDYLGIDVAAGRFFSAWTDNRNVIPGVDPREAPDGFDVFQCRDPTTGPDTCPNAGGLDQNIYGGP